MIQNPDVFDDSLVDAFMHRFYGYGSYCTPYWFIGMEEGGGNSFAEVQRRFGIWHRLGRNELEDAAAYHLELGMPELFQQERVKLQPTWNKLIRIVLSAKDEKITTDLVRNYQQRRLGRRDGETCLLELFPLPSPSTQEWLYGKYSRNVILRDRETYRAACSQWRIAHIRQRVQEHRPKAVVFYGMSYEAWWQQIAGIRLIKDEQQGWLSGSSEGTLFVVAKHPVATGVTSAYFHEIGTLIRNGHRR